MPLAVIFRLTSLCAAGALLLGAALAQIQIPTAPRAPAHGQGAINLIEPIKYMLSGRAWLMAEGLDPGLRARPGWSDLTRLDWQALGSNATSDSAGNILQAPGAAALVPFREPGPGFSRDLLITRDYSMTPYQTEPHLAVNPHDPDHLVLGTIDYNFPGTTSYVSFDGGENWEGPNQVPYLYTDRVSGGDPVLVFDRDENVYYTSISMGIEEFSVGPVYVVQMVSSIAVATSNDGGFTWPQSVSTARSAVSTESLVPDQFGRLRGSIDVGFLDKPWIAVGPHPNDSSRDVLYVTYTDFVTSYDVFWVGEIPATLPREMQTTIRMVRSEDGGRTWSDPVAVSPTVRRGYGTRDDGSQGGGPGVFGSLRVVQGAQPAVGTDGTVFVAWLDSTDDDSMEGVAEIHFARSTDAGATFSSPVVAAVFNEIDFRPRNAYFRYWGGAFPQIAIGPSNELYVAYTGRPSDRLWDDGDIFVVASKDRGATWTRPRRVNDDDGAALQFFPSIDVDPNGVVHMMWGDMRDDPVQTRYHIYYTRSDDGGATWGFEHEQLGFRVGDTRVTDFATNPNRAFSFGLFIGDYFSLQATGEDVYMVWADGRLGEFGGPNQKIGFSRTRSVVSPEIFISPPAGPGGQEVILQGFNFQPDMNVFVQLGDATIAYARTNFDGRFSSRLYMPVTGEGAHTVRAIDATGNVAATSFYTEFGFGDIQRLVRDLSQQIEELRNSGVPPQAEAPLPEPAAVQAGIWGSPGWILVGALLAVLVLALRRAVAQRR